MQLFSPVPHGPSATESALVDWVTTEAQRQYSGLCPRRWYDALLRAAARLANPSWKGLGDFPEPLTAKLVAAHYAEYRTMHANYVTEAPSHELRERLKHFRGRRRRPGAEEWYEDLVFHIWIEEELAERAIIAHALGAAGGA